MPILYDSNAKVYFESENNTVWKYEIEKEFNNEMLMKAEAIRSMRVQAIINEEFGFLDKNKRKANFLAYFKSKAEKKDQKWMKVYQHFSNFVKGQCTFGDVTVELCNRFRDYLLKAKQLKHKDHYISQNSASGYFSTFRALLKIAYKEKFFRENLNDYLEAIDITDVKKEYITLDEVKALANTPCEIPVLISASLFSCMKGLWISDQYLTVLQYIDGEISLIICLDKHFQKEVKAIKTAYNDF